MNTLGLVAFMLSSAIRALVALGCRSSSFGAIWVATIGASSMANVRATISPRIFAFALLLISLLFTSLVAPTHATAAPQLPEPDWAYVEKRLTQAKLPMSFIKEMRAIYNPKDFLKVLELNVLLFFRKTDYHQPQVSTNAIEDIKKFLNTHKNPFAEAEKKFSVSPATISALLWIESRHGANKGSFHVASVYLHLLQADRPSVQRYLKATLPKYTTNYDKSAQATVTKRTKSKSDWALAEIKAMRDIQKKDKSVLKHLKGSYSGAFGMAQFLPSSYVNFAKPFKKGRTPDLTKPDDAIISVANYLNKHGWRNKQHRSHKRALMRYNNSEDYAKAILSLASRAGPPLASAPKPSSPETIREAKKAHAAAAAALAAKNAATAKKAAATRKPSSGSGKASPAKTSTPAKKASSQKTTPSRAPAKKGPTKAPPAKKPIKKPAAAA